MIKYALPFQISPMYGMLRIIEIYDYVSAYRSLVFSADGSMVYNPTLLDIWFTEDGKPYIIKSGETLIKRSN